MKNIKTKTIVSFLILLSLILAFIFGIHWQSTFGERITNKTSTKGLFCFGYNNFLETYQLNCFSPITNKLFEYKKHLECTALTNHQMASSDSQKPNLNELMTIKADDVRFTLDIDELETIISKSREPGEPYKEPYKVVLNNRNIIQGIRNEKINKYLDTVYEFITISKRTGKGMMVWNNTANEIFQGDSLASFFIQCK